MKRKVLILDDQPDVAIPLQMVLEEHGFDATALIFVSDFEKSFAQDTWDAVVLDVFLPTTSKDKLPGLEIARRIRKTHPQLPIVFISAWLVAKEEIDRCATEIGGKTVWKPLGEGKEVIEAILSQVEAK